MYVFSIKPDFNAPTARYRFSHLYKHIVLIMYRDIFQVRFQIIFDRDFSSASGKTMCFVLKRCMRNKHGCTVLDSFIELIQCI